MNVLSVGQLNRYIKSLLESDKKLTDVYIKGEISNYVHHFRSGHFYFTLKDDSGSIRAVMFKSHAQDLRFEPQDGMAVLVRANLSVYERDGVYQLYVTDIQPDGAGTLAIAYDQLKKRLSERGIFDDQFKKPLPVFPKRVGIVTSESGAALQDIINVISRRYPVCELVVCHAQVRGKQAAASIVKAIKTLDSRGNCDVIIVGRGGGSTEDLFAFNDEALAYTIFEAITPIVSAVGHEVDYTICDFVADLRAPTPSAAAELVTPDLQKVGQHLKSLRLSFQSIAEDQLEKRRIYLEKLKSRSSLTHPLIYVEKTQQRLDFFAQSLYNKSHMNMRRFEQKVESRAALLDTLSPLKILGRGYCMVFQDDKVVLDAKALSCGGVVKLNMRDGSVNASILEGTYEKKS